MSPVNDVLSFLDAAAGCSLDQILSSQAPLSMNISRQEYWSEYSLLPGIFLTQGWNLGLLHCRQILYCLSRQGSPKSMIEHVKP